jgi:nucleoside triphosphatase
MSEEKEQAKMPEVITGIFFQNDMGEIALFRGPRWKTIWTIVGGHVEFGEKIEESLAREAFEEVGVGDTNFEFIRVGEMINPPEFFRPAHFIFLHYRSKYNGEFALDNVELTEYKWATITEVLASDEINQSMKETVKMIKEMK